MWKQIIIAGTAGAALVGGGAVALAADSPSSTPSSATATPATGSSSSSSATAKRKPANRGAQLKQALTRLKNFDQAEWVTGPAGSTVTHEAIKGTVSAVSATSIEVKSAAGTSMAFTAGPTTKVVLREGGKGSAKKGTVTDVKTGDHVVVTGTKAGATSAATAIADTGTLTK
jgi:hypothetical protein